MLERHGFERVNLSRSASQRMVRYTTPRRVKDRKVPRQLSPSQRRRQCDVLLLGHFTYDDPMVKRARPHDSVRHLNFLKPARS